MLMTGETSEAELQAAFAEQAEVFATPGPTASWSKPCPIRPRPRLAVAAAHGTGLPVVASMTFGAGREEGPHPDGDHAGAGGRATCWPPGPTWWARIAARGSPISSPSAAGCTPPPAGPSGSRPTPGCPSCVTASRFTARRPRSSPPMFRLGGGGGRPDRRLLRHDAGVHRRRRAGVGGPGGWGLGGGAGDFAPTPAGCIRRERPWGYGRFAWTKNLPTLPLPQSPNPWPPGRRPVSKLRRRLLVGTVVLVNLSVRGGLDLSIRRLTNRIDSRCFGIYATGIELGFLYSQSALVAFWAAFGGGRTLWRSLAVVLGVIAATWCINEHGCL